MYPNSKMSEILDRGLTSFLLCMFCDNMRSNSMLILVLIISFEMLQYLSII